MGEIVGNLLENYWFLDSFGADFGVRDRYGDAEMNRRGVIAI